MKRYLTVLALTALVGCAIGPQQPNRFQAELNAYQEYLLSEIAANRMTKEQGKYLYTQKLNQLRMQMMILESAEHDRQRAANQQLFRAFQPRPEITCSREPFTGDVRCREQ